MTRRHPKPLFQTLLLLLILPLILLAVKKVVDLRKGAAGTPANIVVDVNSLQGSVPSSLWRNLAQGGEEPLDMIGPVFVNTKLLYPELIRIDHLFDYYNVYQGPDNYDFSRLDPLIDSILKTGAKPLLSLSYTTAALAQNGQNAGQPKDWNQWYQLVKATARRYSVDKNITGIYYEVWNEPDLFGGWHYAKDPNYLTLYTHTSRGVVDGAAGSFYKVGGPAITAYYANWMKSLLNHAQRTGLRLDFLSWHKYSKNPEDFDKDITALSRLLSGFPAYQNIEKLITEVGPNSEGDVWYDNKMSGIHFLALSTRLAGKIHRLFPFELVDGPNPKSPQTSGWGLITHPSRGGLPKPRFYALRFLNQLQGQRLMTAGDGTFVTALAAKQNSTIQTLLVNYDPSSRHTETVPVTFQTLKPGKYRLITRNFNPDPNSPAAVSTKIIDLDTFRFTEKFYLNPNTALILELSPI